MRALLSYEAGGPETLRLSQAPAPTPAPGQVVITVKACGINFPDTLIIDDRYQYRPERPFSPGGEVAGIVLDVGPGVAWPRPGMRVLAMCGWGGMAEQVAVPAASCVEMPESMPYDEGAAFLFTYGTAYHALKQRAQVRRGETLLVLGAAGGVGLAAVDIGKALGLEVIAAVSSVEKEAVALRQGVTSAVIYDSANEGGMDARTQAVLFKQACGGAGADIVLDPVGGILSETAVRALGWNGRLLIIGFPAGIARLPLNLLLLKGASAVGVFYGEFAEREHDLNRRNTEELLALYRAQQIKPLISRRYRLDEGGAAISAIAQRRAYGKLVICLDGAELEA